MIILFGNKNLLTNLFVNSQSREDFRFHDSFNVAIEIVLHLELLEVYGHAFVSVFWQEDPYFGPSSLLTAIVPATPLPFLLVFLLSCV